MDEIIDNISRLKIDGSVDKRGGECSRSGKIYELQVYHVLRKCKMNGFDFNTQKEDELGGSSSRSDVVCRLNNEEDVCIEIKKIKTPDWMQCSLKYDHDGKKWFGSANNKIPEKSKLIFLEMLSNINLFNGRIPPFMNRNITHAEWLIIKKETNDFNDVYLECPDDTIKRLYSEKNCRYIQISKKGLYHLGNDVCGFNVPEFICKQRIRIRTKIHTKKDSRGFCILSVTAACQPVNIKNVISSKYSLDDISKLPNNLIHSN